MLKKGHDFEYIGMGKAVNVLFPELPFEQVISHVTANYDIYIF